MRMGLTLALARKVSVLATFSSDICTGLIVDRLIVPWFQYSFNAEGLWIAYKCHMLLAKCSSPLVTRPKTRKFVQQTFHYHPTCETRRWSQRLIHLSFCSHRSYPTRPNICTLSHFRAILMSRETRGKKPTGTIQHLMIPLEKVLSPFRSIPLTLSKTRFV